MSITKRHISIFLFLIAGLFLCNNVFVYGQEEALSEEQILQMVAENSGDSIDVDVQNIRIDYLKYNAGDEVSGIVTIINNSRSEVGDIYYTVRFVGEDGNGNLSIFYDFSEEVGPLSLFAGEKRDVTFSYKIPDYIPQENLGLNIRAFLAGGQRLGWKDIKLDVNGPQVDFLSFGDSQIKIEQYSFDRSDSPYVYKGENISVYYELLNDTETEISVTPRLQIIDTNNKEIVAAYSDSVIKVLPNNKTQVTNGLKTVMDPGVYNVIISFFDQSGEERLEPLVFSYVIDGTIASVASIIAPSYILKRGMELPVSVNYTGQPYDIREGIDRDIKYVTMVINVFDFNGNMIGEKMQQIDSLDYSGTIKVGVPIYAAVDNYIIQAKFIKNGEEIASRMLNVYGKITSENSPLQWVYFLIVFCILAVYLIIKNKSKFLILVFIFAGSLFFTNDVSAARVVYGNGSYNGSLAGNNGAFTPTNVNINIQNPMYVGAPATAYVDFKVVVPAGMSYSSVEVYTYNGAGPANKRWWTTPLIYTDAANYKCDSDVCDQRNYDEWKLHGSPYDLISSCFGSECSYAFKLDLNSTPTLGNKYYLYFYIRNENRYTENGVPKNKSGVALYTQLIDLLDPNESSSAGSLDDACYATPTAGATGNQITWTFRADTNTSPPKVKGKRVDNVNNAYIRWNGDTGSNPVDDPDRHFVPREIYDRPFGCTSIWGGTWNSSTGKCSVSSYCFNMISTPENYPSSYGTCGNFSNKQFMSGADVQSGPWGRDFTTTYSATGTKKVILEIYDVTANNYYGPDTNRSCAWYSDLFNDQSTPYPCTSNWKSLACIPLTISEDACSNISGLQLSPPSGFLKFSGSLGRGVYATTTTDYCYPASLLSHGSVSVNGTPGLADIDENVTWEISISDNYFRDWFEGVWYLIPRNVAVTWSGHITDYAFRNNQSASDVTVVSNATNFDSFNHQKILSYSGQGTPGVSISLVSSGLTISDTSYVTVSPPVCTSECSPCENGVCENNDNGDPTDDPIVESFSINPSFVNTGGQCRLSWMSNSNIESCILRFNNQSISVATSSVGYAVNPGQYRLECQNYAPEIVVAGPLTCLLNPNIKEN